MALLRLVRVTSRTGNAGSDRVQAGPFDDVTRATCRSHDGGPFLTIRRDARDQQRTRLLSVD
jgi:hypothetical protein